MKRWKRFLQEENFINFFNFRNSNNSGFSEPRTVGGKWIRKKIQIMSDNFSALCRNFSIGCRIYILRVQKKTFEGNGFPLKSMQCYLFRKTSKILDFLANSIRGVAKHPFNVSIATFWGNIKIYWKKFFGSFFYLWTLGGKNLVSSLSKKSAFFSKMQLSGRKKTVNKIADIKK